MSFAWSKTPLKMMLILILAFVINFGLILGVQALLSYRVSGPVDEATLAQLDKRYDGCTILTHKEIEYQDLHIYLVRQPDDSTHLITLRKHYLLNRYKLLKGGCLPWTGSDEEITLKAGISRLWVSVKVHEPTGVYRIQHEGSSATQHAGQQFKNQMILSITGLCALELAVWCLVFRKEEIA